jgi:hypothetical protein
MSTLSRPKPPRARRIQSRVKLFVGIPRGPEGRLDRAKLENAVRYGFRIVRWHLGVQA